MHEISTLCMFWISSTGWKSLQSASSLAPIPLRLFICPAYGIADKTGVNCLSILVSISLASAIQIFTPVTSWNWYHPTRGNCPSNLVWQTVVFQLYLKSALQLSQPSMLNWNMPWCLHKYYSAVDTNLQKRLNIPMVTEYNGYFSLSRTQAWI